MVVRAQSGDEWAREALFVRHLPSARRLAIRLTARLDLGDDVVQDAFSEALRDLHKLRNPGAFRVWLMRIVVNRARKAHRRLKVVRLLGLDRGIDDATLALQASPDAGPDVMAELTRVDTTLATLPREQRIAWMLRYVQQENLPAVAELTGCSLATAKRRIASAQAVLDAKLRKDLP